MVWLQSSRSESAFDVNIPPPEFGGVPTLLGIHHSPSKTAASTTVHPSLPHPLSHPTHSHPTLQISRLTTTPPNPPGPRTPCTPPTPYSSRYRTSRAATRRPSHGTNAHSSADRIHA